MSTLSAISTEHRLADLLQYDLAKKKKSEIGKGLKEYTVLLRSVLRAIDSLERKELEKFDGLVGETACHIRALKIASIADKILSDLHFLNARVLKVLKKIEVLTSTKTIDPFMVKGVSLADIFKIHELDINLTADEMFVLESYLLTEAKEEPPETEIMPSLFKSGRAAPHKLQESDLSSLFFKNLVRNLRRRLSEDSVQFMKDVALELQDPSLLKMLSSDYVVEHNNCVCLPLFWSIKAVLKLAQKEGIPLVIHTKFLETLDIGYRVKKEELLFYKPIVNAEEIAFVESVPEESDLEKPACFIQGSACAKSREEWKKAFSKQSIAQVILAAAADHGQYPGANQALDVEDAEYEASKKLAEEGFSLSNPSTFFTQHIYPAPVKKMFSLIKG